MSRLSKDSTIKERYRPSSTKSRATKFKYSANKTNPGVHFKMTTHHKQGGFFFFRNERILNTRECVIITQDINKLKGKNTQPSQKMQQTILLVSENRESGPKKSGTR